MNLHASFASIEYQIIIDKLRCCFPYSIHALYLPQGRRLPPPRPHSPAGSEHRRMGRTQTPIPAEKQKAVIRHHAAQRQAERPPGGDRLAGKRYVFSAGKTDGRARGRHRTAQSQKSDGLGRHHEQHPLPRRGSRVP